MIHENFAVFLWGMYYIGKITNDNLKNGGGGKGEGKLHMMSFLLTVDGALEICAVYKYYEWVANLHKSSAEILQYRLLSWQHNGRANAHIYLLVWKDEVC